MSFWRDLVAFRFRATKRSIATLSWSGNSLTLALHTVLMTGLNFSSADSFCLNIYFISSTLNYFFSRKYWLRLHNDYKSWRLGLLADLVSKFNEPRSRLLENATDSFSGVVL